MSTLPVLSQPALDAGGGFLGLDPTDPKDQALIRREIARHPGRWKRMDDKRRAYIVACLGWAMRTGRQFVPAEDEHSLDGAKLVVSAAKTLVAIEGQNQADEHHEKGSNVNVNHTHQVRFIKGVNPEAL